MRRWLGLALGVAIACWGGPAGHAEGADRTWTWLGPPGPGRVEAITVDPGWPANPGLTIRRAAETFASRDGGASWERLEDGPRTPERASWSAEREAAQLVRAAGVAPIFQVVDGQARRSRDGGATWQTLEPAPGQTVQQLALSPAFALDQTLYLSAVSGGFPSFMADSALDQPSDDHARSLGLLVSRDGGESWASVADGLAIAGVPYRHVERFALSPNFAEDGTLFAFAWGPRAPAESGPLGHGRAWRGALFRSQDRGARWEPVYRLGEPTGPGLGFSARATFALSPDFAADGVALLAEQLGGLSPGGASCVVLRTDDHGLTWRESLPGGSFDGCNGLALFGGGESLVGLVQKPSIGWQVTWDAGRSWSSLRPPDGHAVMVAPSPTYALDRTLFVGTDFGGLWSLGPARRAEEGRLPCPVPLGRHFARVWQAEPWARARLGCPAEPEELLELRWQELDRPNQPRRLLWALWGAELAQPFELFGTSWSGSRELNAPAEADGVVFGAGQRFDGGTLFWLPPGEAPAAVLVLSEPDHQWRRLPD